MSKGHQKNKSKKKLSVLPQPDRSVAGGKRIIVVNGFLGTVQRMPAENLASIVAFCWLGSVRQWYRFSMPLSHPIVQEFLQSGPHHRQGEAYALLQGFGPLWINGILVGTDRNRGLDNKSNLTTQVLANVELERGITEEDVLSSVIPFAGITAHDASTSIETKRFDWWWTLIADGNPVMYHPTGDPTHDRCGPKLYCCSNAIDRYLQFCGKEAEGQAERMCAPGQSILDWAPPMLSFVYCSPDGLRLREFPSGSEEARDLLLGLRSPQEFSQDAEYLTRTKKPE